MVVDCLAGLTTSGEKRDHSVEGSELSRMRVEERKTREGIEEETQFFPDEWGQEIISNREGGVHQSRQLPYVRMVLIWNACLGVLGGSLIYRLENRKWTWLDCVFLAINSSTATGLSSLDITMLSAASLTVVAVLMQFGAATLLSLFPVVVRTLALEGALPRLERDYEHGGQCWLRRWRHKRVTFDLRKYRLVPEWLVEYKALCFLLRIVVAYHAVVYCVYGGTLALAFRYMPAVERAARANVGASALGWATFTTISAFNNVGFVLQRGGFASLNDQPLILFVTGMLVLHGNVLYPACLRWIIVGISASSPRDSNRKVYFRYLLLHGRKLYSNLFSSQATWLLVATQLALISLQIGVTLIVSHDDKSFSNRSPNTRLDIAAFQAVNTRHAGIAAVNLASLHGGTLVMQMAMMWLAPVPVVAALRSSHHSSGRALSNVEVPSSPGSGDDVAALRRRRHASGRRITVALGSTCGDDLPTPGRLEHAVPDAMVDTRALLLERYPDRSPPWTERVSTRLEAFSYHCRLVVADAYRSSGFARDAALIFLAWFAIACFENFKHTDQCKATHDSSRGLFYAAFELASAFGNVGLSLGSIQHSGANKSFSGDLSPASLLVLIVVMLGARTRELPRRIDASLTLPNISGSDVLRATVVNSQGQAFNLAFAPDSSIVDNPALTAPLATASPNGTNTSTLHEQPDSLPDCPSPSLV